MEIKEFFLHKFFINLAVAHFFGHPICLVGLLNTKCEKYERRYIIYRVSGNWNFEING